MRRPFHFVAGIVSGLILFSGNQGMFSATAIAAPADGAFKIRMEVELTTIEVAAIGDDGKPVRNLKQEDFQLFEDGKRQDIYSLDEVTEEAKPASLGANLLDEGALPRGKTVMILFDDASIQPQYIKASRESAEKFVKEHMRAQDIFAVASFGMSLQILQNFTHDSNQVLKAITQPAAANAGSGTIYFENLLRSLNEVNTSLSRIRGRKSILIYTQPLSSMRGTPMGNFGGGGRRSMGGSNIFSSGNGSGTLDSTYRNTLDAIRKADVLVYTIDPGALTSTDNGISLSLRSFAAESGGFSIRDTNQLEAELSNLDKQLSNYYILGFDSNNTKHTGGFRKIEIRTKLKGVSLKYRENVQDKRPIDTLESDKKEKNLLSALASPEAAVQLPILFRPLYFYESSKIARVLVAARIQMDKIAVKKKGSQSGADINVMGIAYGEDGGTASRFSETVPIRFDKDDSHLNNSLTYRNYFMLHPGKYRLKLAVSDESNNLGSAEQTLEIPPLLENKMTGGSLIVAEKAVRLPNLIQNLQMQLLDSDDPLIFSGMQIEPSIGNIVRKNTQLPIMFRLYHIPGNSNQWNLTAHIKLLDDKGKEYDLAPMPIKKYFSPLKDASAAIGMPLSFPNASPGKYRLILEVVEEGSKQSAVLQTDLEIVP
jgi:VWFA-related protein